MELANWLADENLESLSACMDLMVPPGMSQHTDILLHLVREPEDSSSLSPLQVRMVNLLKERGDLRGRQVERAFAKLNWRAVLTSLENQLIVSSVPFLSPTTVKPKGYSHRDAFHRSRRDR